MGGLTATPYPQWADSDAALLLLKSPPKHTAPLPPPPPPPLDINGTPSHGLEPHHHVPSLEAAITDFNSSFVNFLGVDEEPVRGRRVGPGVHEHAQLVGGDESEGDDVAPSWAGDDGQEEDDEDDDDGEEDAEGEFYEDEVDAWRDPVDPSASQQLLLHDDTAPVAYSQHEYSSGGSSSGVYSSPPAPQPHEIPSHPGTVTAQPQPDLPPTREQLSFIPPLSRPRNAHLSHAYTNEEDDEEEDYEEDIVPVQEETDDDDSGMFEDRKPVTASSSRQKRVRTKPAKLATSVSIDGPAPLRRTEIPAVEDDPSIRPYQCHLCWTRFVAAQSPKGKGKRSESEESGDSSTLVSDGSNAEDGPASFRTVRELREHCGIHKRAGENLGETPFRCALDPCGKIFKSAAGLLWHFTNASGGHFFVSMEDGEDRPSKKFKKIVEANGRSEHCPVSGCTKAFKQAAGLAYHLAHAAKHAEFVTEAMIATFSPKLVSKTRWWFAKRGLPISGDRKDAGSGYDDESSGEDY